MFFDSPLLIFTKDKTTLGDVKKDTSDFRILLKDFMPLKINRFEVNDRTIHYVDNTSIPKVDITFRQTHALAINLKSVIDKDVELPSTVIAQASAYEGTVNFNMKLNALAVNATFDLNAEIKNANLVLLNDFLKAYGSFGMSNGRLGLYIVMAAKKGKFKGYVKPIIKDLKVIGPQDRHDSFTQQVWQHIEGAAGVVLRNQKKDQVATKVMMEGNLKIHIRIPLMLSGRFFEMLLCRLLFQVLTMR